MSPQKSRLKVAIVDDSEHSRKGISSILESEGYDVVGTYSNGNDAIKDFQIIGANLFIIDVVMPDISGIEVAKVISDKNRNAYIIMMSSLDSEHIVIEAISNGATDFIQKPFEKDVLLKSVEKIERELQKES